MTELSWQWKRFDDLCVHELFDVFRLRQAVFVVEQNCAYSDIDDIDKGAWHLLAYKNQILCAYARVYKLTDTQANIGRILTHQEFRGEGIGKTLMEKTLNFIKQRYPQTLVKISAQLHLEAYYSAFGFIKTSQPYDEDGILHIDMSIPIQSRG